MTKGCALLECHSRSGRAQSSTQVHSQAVARDGAELAIPRSTTDEFTSYPGLVYIGSTNVAQGQCCYHASPHLLVAPLFV